MVVGAEEEEDNAYHARTTCSLTMEVDTLGVEVYDQLEDASCAQDEHHTHVDGAALDMTLAWENRSMVGVRKVDTTHLDMVEVEVEEVMGLDLGERFVGKND